MNTKLKMKAYDSGYFNFNVHAIKQLQNTSEKALRKQPNRTWLTLHIFIWFFFFAIKKYNTTTAFYQYAQEH